MSDYSRERRLYDEMLFNERMAREFGKPSIIPKLNRRLKCEVRALRKSHTDPIAFSLRQRERIHSKREGEYWCEYCILHDVGQTADDMRRLVMDSWMRNTTPYDCSGRPVTTCIGWSRQPAGIVWIHHKVLDV